ncbi:MAG: RNA 2',3'-cyclic phosphodiesterase [Candidatus Wallbacteria bacterium]|nr:RNA 2',3'-cyclic phosphodiesterase [Candidatus Wallbacteria bacterium]
MFVGVPMPDAAQMALSKLQAELRERPELAWNVSWPKAAGLHITLQFLGEISPPRARLVGRVLEEIAAGFKPFTLDLFGVGAFPKAGRASILWAGVRSGAEVLCKFQRELETRLIQNGFAREEHVFEPHLTLVRLRMPADLRAVVRQYAKFGLAGIPVGSVHVMQSELLRGGAVYTPLSTAVLGSPTKSEQSA